MIPSLRHLSFLSLLSALLALASTAQGEEPPALCVFCSIVAGRAPAEIVYRDAHVLAFMDRAPRNPGHVLVIPVEHAANLMEVPPATLSELALVVQKIAQALPRVGVKIEGVQVQSNNGRAAGQSVFHLHFHVIPRFAGEPAARGEKAVGDPTEIAQIATRLRAALTSSARKD